MNESDPHFQRRFELANLPPDHPGRRDLEVELRSLDSAEREYWENLLIETDHIHAELTPVEMSEDLKGRLLSLPDLPVARPVWKVRLDKIASMPLGWRTIAAVAAIVVMAVAIPAYWPASMPPKPPAPVALAEPLALDLAKTAVEIHQSPPEFTVAGEDGNRIETSLNEGNAFPFPVKVLRPQSNVTLLGGGVCDFHGTPAAFTRWVKDGTHYTVYQFDGTKLGVPANFQMTTEASPSLTSGTLHPHVVIWPGAMGKCTWAVVLESDDTPDLFSSCYL